HRSAEARGRDGRGRAALPQRAGVPARARARARAGRAATADADDRSPLRSRHRRIPRRAAGEDALLERLQAARPVVGRASPLLGNPRAAAFAALLGSLLAYYELRHLLPTPRLWIQVVVIACVVIPAMFALIWLALPLSSSRYMLPAALVLGAVALGCELAHFYRVSNFAKFGAYAALGFWFLRWFEEASWVVLVACIIPLVDAFSVYRGPTKSITRHHPNVYGHMAVAFVAPGKDGGAMFGPPDILFFALFTSSAVRFRLR